MSEKLEIDDFENEIQEDDKLVQLRKTYPVYCTFLCVWNALAFCIIHYFYIAVLKRGQKFAQNVHLNKLCIPLFNSHISLPKQTWIDEDIGPQLVMQSCLPKLKQT